MNKIFKLPKQISDKIAAGEVVTGPISVVKELVENSIDAGSDSIIIEIKEGGKTYIRVTDNGFGIVKDDVELAFQPHATSKIKDENDLNSIETLGFRGEALTSIAAVSKLEIITKTEDERVGTSLYIEGGDIIDKKDIGANNGTTIIVKDLFFNTPARLKFMKSERAESTKIIDFISRIAVAYPDMKIRMINNGNILFSTTGKGDVLNNIFLVFGTEKKEDLIPVEEEIKDYKLTAYISPSNITKKTRRNQIYFVNGRVINSKTLENAITKGYEEFVFEGRHPIAYVFLEINPEKLDVNVHPAKTEIRFDEKSILSEFIYKTIHNRLKTKDAIPDISTGNQRKPEQKSIFKINEQDKSGSEISEGEKNEGQKLQGNKSENGSKIEQVNIKTLLSNYREKDENNDPNKTQKPDSEINNIGNLKDDTNNGYINDISKSDTFEESHSEFTDKTSKPKNLQTLEISKLNVIDSIFATYILATDDDSFYIIDQHAAHERINYELFLKQFYSEDKLTQQILSPLMINVSASVMNHINKWMDVINNLGYEAEIFGDKAIKVSAVPAFLSLNEAEDMLKDIIDNIGIKVPENEAAIERLIQRSCKASVKANDLLKREEIKTLLSDLAVCDNPFACPHGRPVFVKLTKYDVEKLFKRV